MRWTIWNGIWVKLDETVAVGEIRFVANGREVGRVEGIAADGGPERITDALTERQRGPGETK